MYENYHICPRCGGEMLGGRYWATCESLDVICTKCATRYRGNYIIQLRRMEEDKLEIEGNK